MKIRKTLLVGLTLSFLSGCAGMDIGSNIEGYGYLMTENYAGGAERFQEIVKEKPSSAEANFYLGRFFMAQEKVESALPYLQKAARLGPDNADYQFWLGVAYGERKMAKKEAAQYEKVLLLNPSYVAAHLYLGHNLLKKGQVENALASYKQVLELAPRNQSALYNRALIMHILERSPEEKLAWRIFLRKYPAGPMALRATDHLNRLEDFSYRNHKLGLRRVTLTKIWFKAFDGKLSKSSYKSLNLIGEIVSNMPEYTLQVLVYQKNNKLLAQARAESIREYLLENFPQLEGRVNISWFDVDDTVTAKGKKVAIGESVRFFLTR